jgi:hypothetical protein
MIKSLITIFLIMVSPCLAVTTVSHSMHYESPCGSESLSVSVCFGNHDDNMMKLSSCMSEDNGIQMQGVDVTHGGDLALTESYLNSVIQSNIKFVSYDRNTGWKSAIKEKAIDTKVITTARISLDGGSNVMTTPDTYLALDNASPGTGVGIRAD